MIDEPAQTEAFVPALLVENELTVIITELVLVHPVALTVSVNEYVVVAVGDTEGLEEVEVKPDGFETQE